MEKTVKKGNAAAGQTSLKQCARCKKWKDRSCFRRKSTSKDGLSYWCKECLSEHERIRYAAMVKGTVRKYRRYQEYHRIVGSVKQKQCIKCKEWKPERKFYRHRSAPDGLQVWCKVCADKITNDARRRRQSGSESMPR